MALSEGHNTVLARAVAIDGAELTDSISIALDTTPPYITIDSPIDGATVKQNTIAVTGLVNDIVRGTVNADQANVSVNNKTATVSNRSYLAEGIVLTEGDNSITVSASDQQGNTASKTITVKYQVPDAKHIEIISGQNQSGKILSVLTAPLKIKLINENGEPVANTNVVYRVIQGDGVAGAGTADESQGVLTKTNAEGIASTIFKLGSRSGKGNHKVRAKAVGFDSEVVFYASAETNPGNKVSINAGNNQRGAPNQSLPQPLIVAVTDQGANLVQGTRIEFKVTTGGGRFQNGETTYISITDSDGRATASLTLGDEIGLDVHRVTAKIIGTELTAGFTASALQPGDPGQTSITGIVLDKQDNPLPKITVRIEGNNRQAQTDAQGQFKITEAPVGPIHLIVDGSTTTATGEWPTLSYNIVTIAGAENPLAAPVYMVKLDTENAVYVGKEDQIITLKEVPGFKLEVKAGSITFPDGAKEGHLSVTPVNASKIPMAPPNGMQPQFVVTIQPTGAIFDPPAPLTLPNVDGHKPGAEVEMYSFDHDLEEFVSIGLGTVSTDGSVIKTNTGIGVIKAGWHCGSQPGGQGCTHNCKLCQDCNADCNCMPINGEVDPRQKDIKGDCHSPICEIGLPINIIDNSDIPNEVGDCKKNGACTNGDPSYESDDLDKPKDVIGDCKKPICNNGSPDTENDDIDKPDPNEDPDNYCKTCNQGHIAPDVSKNGILIPGDKCKKCNEGGIVNLEIGELTAEISSRSGIFDIGVDGEINECPSKTPASIGFTAIVSGGDSCFRMFLWDFGDGNTSNIQNPTNAFAIAGDFSVKVEMRCDGCISSVSSSTSVKIGEGKTLAKIKNDYNIMIAGANAFGWNVAADNLQHFLNATGNDLSISSNWLLGFSSVLDAVSVNLNRFETMSLPIKVSSLAPGTSVTFTDHWDRLLYANILTEAELFYASGGSTVTSTGTFIITKSTTGSVTITGSVLHRWHDPYDWHGGLDAPVPGFGNVSDDDALCLIGAGMAKEFSMEATWSQVLSYDPSSGDFSW